VAKPSQTVNTIYYEDVDSLIPWEDNYNVGDIGLIIEGIKQYGFAGAIKVWKDNQVRGGNHTLMAVRELHKQWLRGEGMATPANIKVDLENHWLVPCISIAHLNELEAIGFAIFDNRSAAKASQNDEMLFEYLQHLADQDNDLITGYDDEDMALLQRLVSEPVTMEENSGDVGQAFDTFMNSTIKQIVLYMDAPKFISTVERLSKVMQAAGLENNTEVVLFLLDQYEAANPQNKEDTDE
jgi:hypothetical protein